MSLDILCSKYYTTLQRQVLVLVGTNHLASSLCRRNHVHHQRTKVRLFLLLMRLLPFPPPFPLLILLL